MEAEVHVEYKTRKMKGEDLCDFDEFGQIGIRGEKKTLMGFVTSGRELSSLISPC